MSIDLQLFLCDSASTDPSGKVHMLGVGWTMTRSPTAPHALVAIINVPRETSARKVHLTISLVDDEGEAVQVGPDDGERQPIKMEYDVEAGPRPGVPDDLPMRAVLAMQIGQVPVPHGRYRWRLNFEDQMAEVRFAVLTKTEAEAALVADPSEP